MAARHVGEGSEVRELAERLKSELDGIVQLTTSGKRLVSSMQADVKDDAYTKAEEIVNQIAKSVLDSLPDCQTVAVKLKEYGAYLDEIASH